VLQTSGPTSEFCERCERHYGRTSWPISRMNELQPESERGVEDWQGCRRRASVMGIRTWMCELSGSVFAARAVQDLTSSGVWIVQSLFSACFNNKCTLWPVWSRLNQSRSNWSKCQAWYDTFRALREVIVSLLAVIKHISGNLGDPLNRPFSLPRRTT